MFTSAEFKASCRRAEQGSQRVEALASLSGADLASRDIAETNLLFAEGLPCAEDIDVSACLRQLDEWADLVDHGTRRTLPKFRAAPEQYEGCEARFRMLVFVTVLRRNLGLSYNLPFSTGEYDGSDSRNLFLHGLLNGWGGTCSTFPVLYVAIGRRLGYPLSIVRSLQHLFCRWDDGAGTRFNIEATSPGFAPLGDEHFRNRPRPITDEQIHSHKFLRSLSPREELAVFAFERGACLGDNQMHGLSLSMFQLAADLAPDVESYRATLMSKWVVCRLAQAAHKLLSSHAIARAGSLNVEGLIDRASCGVQLTDDWERNMLPGAREDLWRIVRNAMRRHAEGSKEAAVDQFFATLTL